MDGHVGLAGQFQLNFALVCTLNGRDGHTPWVDDIGAELDSADLAKATVSAMLEKNIIINRMENGRQVALKFNYDDVQKGKNLHQNIELRPGDTVIVP